MQSRRPGTANGLYRPNQNQHHPHHSPPKSAWVASTLLRHSSAMAAASTDAGEVAVTAGAPNMAYLGPTKVPCEAPTEGDTAADPHEMMRRKWKEIYR
jgi:hypothetical protein